MLECMYAGRRRSPERRDDYRRDDGMFVCMYVQYASVTFVCVPVCMFVCMHAVVAVPSAEEVYDAVLLVMCRAATRMSSFVNVANIGS